MKQQHNNTTSQAKMRIQKQQRCFLACLYRQTYSLAFMGLVFGTSALFVSVSWSNFCTGAYRTCVLSCLDLTCSFRFFDFYFFFGQLIKGQSHKQSPCPSPLPVFAAKMLHSSSTSLFTKYTLPACLRRWSDVFRIWAWRFTQANSMLPSVLLLLTQRQSPRGIPC